MAEIYWWTCEEKVDTVEEQSSFLPRRGPRTSQSLPSQIRQSCGIHHKSERTARECSTKRGDNWVVREVSS